jgi:hypothetical protein
LRGIATRLPHKAINARRLYLILRHSSRGKARLLTGL